MEYTRSSSAWGKYPVYDLTMRLWDPEEWKKLSISAHDGFAKIAAETSQLGTLPNDDFKNIGMIPLPTADIEYAAQFSARNGSWSQTLILRHTPPNGWKFATLVRKSRKVAKSDAELRNQPVLCYFADPGFPEKEPNELTQWAQNAPKCEAGSHP